MSSSSDSASSMGSTTSRSTSSGSAPGYWTMTSEPGNFSDGSSERGIDDSTHSPVAISSANTTSVNCQRLTENDHRLIALPSGAVEHADAVVVVEPGRAFRHDPVAQRESRDHLDPLSQQAPCAHGDLARDAALGDDEHGGEAAVRLEQRSHRH